MQALFASYDLVFIIPQSSGVRACRRGAQLGAKLGWQSRSPGGACTGRPDVCLQSHHIVQPKRGWCPQLTDGLPLSKGKNFVMNQFMQLLLDVPGSPSGPPGGAGSFPELPSCCVHLCLAHSALGTERSPWSLSLKIRLVSQAP